MSKPKYHTRTFICFIYGNINLYFSFKSRRRTSQECIASLILTKRLLHSTRRSTEFEKLSRVNGFCSYSIAFSINAKKYSNLALTIFLTLQNMLIKSYFYLCSSKSSSWIELIIFLFSPSLSFKKSKTLPRLVSSSSIASILILCFTVGVTQEIQYLQTLLALWIQSLNSSIHVDKLFYASIHSFSKFYIFDHFSSTNCSDILSFRTSFKDSRSRILIALGLMLFCIKCFIKMLSIMSDSTKVSHFTPIFLIPSMLSTNFGKLDSLSESLASYCATSKNTIAIGDSGLSIITKIAILLLFGHCRYTKRWITIRMLSASKKVELKRITSPNAWDQF